MSTNPAVAKLPTHLKDYIIDQNYNQYTGRNQAVWRYVMRRNLDYLCNVAHESYLEGLKQTGVGIDKIPSLDKMNEILERIGWGAVCVDGFIPPPAFMEFQAHKVLVIAADIRSINQIEYTPAPDIIHEAAGHAPIIADANYAEYLRKFGEIGSKAFSSSYDKEIYEAIRHLSILKADPNCGKDEIKRAESQIAHLEANPAPPSEMALIRNLHWWTVEYGLIGTVENPKIYGAGLLSSIGESVWALSGNVEKISYSLEAMDYSFDITKPQPQLFVTPSFEYLNKVLDEFKCTMSYSVGGIHGLNKAKDSKDLATVVLKSGLQISGIFTHYLSQGANIIYVQSNGPSALSYNNKQLIKHGKNDHMDGYGTVIGKLKGLHKPMRKISNEDFINLGIIAGQVCHLEFDSGIKVVGKYRGHTRKDNKLLIISFEDCTVTYKDNILFKPEWGIYDMGIGEQVISVYAGLADPESYELRLSPPSEITRKVVYSDTEREILAFYDQVRDLAKGSHLVRSSSLINKIIAQYPYEWLLLLEAYEYTRKDLPELAQRIKDVLSSHPFSKDDKKLIKLGLELVSNFS